MNFSRDYLKDLQDKNFGEEHYSVLQKLVQKILNKEKVSLAEEKYACSSIPHYVNSEGVPQFDVKELEGCKNFLFRTIYVLYSSDLNGNKNISDAFGEISAERKQWDVQFLHNAYLEWKKVLAKKLNGFKPINYLAQEYNYQRKELIKFCKQSGIGSRYREYLLKSLVLHSKLIYLTVMEFYEEVPYDEQIILIDGSEVLVDSYSYIHTLFRHFAEHLKTHLTSKSYHFDFGIDFEKIPEFIYQVLIAYKNAGKETNFNRYWLAFNFNSEPYMLWFSPFTKSYPGGIVKTLLRAQTLYPIKLQRDNDKIKNLNKVRVSSDIEFYI